MQISGNPLEYLFVFLGGIALSFTPCVYPLIPVTAGYIGIQAAGSKLKGLVLSFIYVSGIAVTYSLLGLLASLTGTVFGKISSHPLTSILTGSIIVVFGLSMLNVFALYFPSVTKLSRFRGKGYFSIFLLGLASGLVMSPCVSPALGAILVYLATKNNLVYGITLLMVFAYGMGLTLILVGTFSGIMLNFPKSGKWLVYVERICAVIVIGAGIYFIYNGIRRI